MSRLPVVIGLTVAALLLTFLVFRARVGVPASAPEVLGPDVTFLAQARVDGGLVMLGARATGEWVVAFAGDERGARHEERPADGRPLTVILDGVAVVAGRAPEGAARFELVTEQGEVIRGKVTNGAYLAAWRPATAKPAFLLRILDASGTETYRWPPPGGLPAA